MLAFQPIRNKIHYGAKWLNPILNSLGIYLTILLFEFFLFRIYEFIYLKKYFQFNPSNAIYELKGLYFDFLFVSLISIVAVIPFLFIYKLSEKLTRGIFLSINSIVVISTLILIDYLRHTNIPLDHALFAYPLKEIIYITKTSVSIGFWQTFKYLVAFTLSIAFTTIVLKKIKSSKFYIVAIVFLVSGIFLTKNLNPARKNYSNDTSFNLTINKLSYLAKTSFNYFKGNAEYSLIEYQNIIKDYQKAHNEFNYTSYNYPFEHIQDTSDVLGPFFNLNESPPNIVLIVMESLSSAFCGSNAYLGNFTPFIDSLINHSLYWENFLSTSERTFNALPSLTGSLPYGEKGFMNYIKGSSAVNHNTLIQFLNENNYHTNFFYGGWIGFDNMHKFLKYQNTDFILRNFGEKYSIIEKDKDGFSWGYPDHALYQRSIEVIDSINVNPRFDIYLTLSLHHPFKPPHQEYYDSLFTQEFEKQNLSDKQRKETQIYSHILTTALYTDQALKQLFQSLKKREDFNNTIFIITGDHRLGSQNKKNQIDLYHVPFIIYSPMLKKAQTFSSVSSHANLSPALFSFFAENYKFNVPEISHSLGLPIDTSNAFRNIHKLSFMRTNRTITDYLSNEYFISGDELFILNDGMELKRIQNPELLDSLKQNLEKFKILNLYTLENNLVSSK